MIVLETEHLLLRQPLLNDFDALARIYAEPQVMKYISGGSPFSPGALRESLKAHAATFEQGGFGKLSVIDHQQGEVIGQCGFQTVVIDGVDTPVLTCMLDRTCWGRGLGTEALSAVRDHAFAELGMNTVHVLVHPTHEAGAHLAEKLGMNMLREVFAESRNQHLYAAQRDSNS